MENWAKTYDEAQSKESRGSQDLAEETKALASAILKMNNVDF